MSKKVIDEMAEITRAAISSADAGAITELSAKQIKIESVIRAFHSEANERAEGLERSIKYMTDPGMKKYTQGQADAYAWCVEEILRMLSSA